MTFALKAWGMVRRIPAELFAALALVAIMYAIAAWHGRVIDRAELRGAENVRAQSAVTVAQYEGANAALRAALKRAQDSVKIVHVRTKARTDTVRLAIAAIPDSLKSVPEIANLAEQATRLTADVERLMAVRITEQQAYETVIANDSTTIRAMAVTINLQTDSLRTVERERDARVKKSTVVKIAGAAIGTGYAIAKWVVPLITKGN